MRKGLVRDGKSLAAAGGADVVLSTFKFDQDDGGQHSGIAAGRPARHDGADAKPLSVSLMDLIGKRIRIIGTQQNGPEYLYEALDFVAQEKVKTIVERYPLAQAAKAYDRVAEGKARFRPVLRM
jgi:D-arabinose 1-dehydrogenase-like Zn-dependent alcohol dehydrogenase